MNPTSGSSIALYARKVPVLAFCSQTFRIDHLTIVVGNPPYMSASDAPGLIGGRSRSTGKYLFPVPETAVRDADVELVELHRTGRVWSYTVQRFRPKSPPYDGPEQFEPYIVALIELPEQLIVASRLVGVAAEHVHIGLEVEFSPLELKSHDGAIRISHAFRPLDGGQP